MAGPVARDVPWKSMTVGRMVSALSSVPGNLEGELVVEMFMGLSLCKRQIHVPLGGGQSCPRLSVL